MHARRRGGRVVWTNARADQEVLQAVSLGASIQLLINATGNATFTLQPRPDLPAVNVSYANITLAGAEGFLLTALVLACFWMPSVAVPGARACVAGSGACCWARTCGEAQQRAWTMLSCSGPWGERHGDFAARRHHLLPC